VKVAISISESPDLGRLGYAKIHLATAMAELARYVLNRGDSLAYGGDFRQDGFTKLLFDLVRSHTRPGDRPWDKIAWFLAWPVQLEITADQEFDVLDVARLHRVPAPSDLANLPSDAVPKNTPEGRHVWARCLTAMRAAMTGHLDARVLLGGQLGASLSVVPGLAEEAYLTLHAGKPLFLLGGFGGCTAEVIAALKGEPAKLLGAKALRAHPAYKDLKAHYRSARGTLLKPGEDVAAKLRKFGVDGLCNGLDIRENERLFITEDVPEMVALVLRGLHRLARKAELPEVSTPGPRGRSARRR
jgi:hypothetical protein